MSNPPGFPGGCSIDKRERPKLSGVYVYYVRTMNESEERGPMTLSSRIVAAGALVSASVIVAGCASDQVSGGPEGTIEVTSPATPVFQPKDVDPVEVTDFMKPVHDPGLNVNFWLRGTTYGNIGGAILSVEVENLNDAVLPPEAIDSPKLTLSDGTTVERLDAEASGVAGQDGLVRPLGAQASTVLRYPFDVAPGNLWDAKLEIGNVRFVGNLNN